MALDARSRSSIYQHLVPILGEHDANELMSQFPSIEADELVTKQFLRAELALAEGGLRGEIAGLRADLRGEMGSLETRLTVRLGSAIAASTALVATIGLLS